MWLLQGLAFELLGFSPMFYSYPEGTVTSRGGMGPQPQSFLRIRDVVRHCNNDCKPQARNPKP